MKRKIDSNYENHLIQENHSLDSNFEILHTKNKGPKLNLLGCLQRNKHKNSNNFSKGHNDINNSWDLKISKTIKNIIKSHMILSLILREILTKDLFLRKKNRLFKNMLFQKIKNSFSRESY